MSLITINVSGPPRGQGASGALKVGVQSMHGSFAWGGSPGSATIVFVNNDQPNLSGQLIEIGFDNHWFAGICKSDTGNQSSRGSLREVQFVDLRDFLTWDFVWCMFNMPIRRWVNGVWKRRWWHIYPSDYDTCTKTFTDDPLPAWEILAALFNAPTVGTDWTWDLTGNGLFSDGLMNQPIYSFDCFNGVRLDAALNDISQRGGLVFTHAPTPDNNYRLVWMRKGYGLLPFINEIEIPSNSDDQRYGLALSGNATNIRVTGERNRYLVLNVPLTPDWNTAWEQFLNSDALFLDIFQNEKDPVLNKPYTSFPNDAEQWQGANAAKVRSLQITVGEYVDLRNARDGNGAQFIDRKKFSGRSRMDMPAALYLQSLLFRAYVPNVSGIVNLNGESISLDSVNILDSMPCRVTYDPVSGTMEGDTDTLADGNGVAIVQGINFGEDLFDLVKPDRITATFFSANNRPWTATSFQIDDSGEGQRFIIFDQPCFTSENLLTTVNGFQVLNANPILTAAVAQAALTFELEPFSYWKGTFPDVSRDHAEYVSGLCAEFVGRAGQYQEILFADGQSAAGQADVIAANLLLCQYIYFSGGYRLIRKNLPLGTALSSFVDRVEVEFNPQGFLEIVDLTTERGRSNFEPERDLDRRTQQNSLFPGQAQLKQTAREYQRFGAGLKGLSRDLMNRFVQFLKGDFGDDMKSIRLDDTGVFEIPTGETIPAGTPIFAPPVDTTSGTPVNTLGEWPPNFDPAVDTIFCGVTVRDGEDAANPFFVKASGETLARVQGPINAGDPLGAADSYLSYNTLGAYFVKGGSLGAAMQTISDTSVKLIKVNLGANADTGGDVWLP